MKFSIQDLTKNKNAIYTALFIFIILLDLLFILRLQIKSVAKTTAQLKKAKSELILSRQDIASFGDLSGRLENLKKSKDLEARQFIWDDEILALLGNLSAMAETNSVAISQIKPQKGATLKEISSPTGKFYLLPVTVDAQAGYHHLGRFLTQVENDARFMKVLTLDINQDSRDYLHHLIKLKIGVLTAKR